MKKNCERIKKDPEGPPRNVPLTMILGVTNSTEVGGISPQAQMTRLGQRSRGLIKVVV